MRAKTARNADSAMTDQPHENRHPEPAPTAKPLTARTVLVACVLGLLAVDIATGQRRRPTSRGTRPQPSQAPEAKKEEAEKKKVEKWLAVTGADIYLGTGQLLRRGTILVGDDKIKKVGHDIEIPEGAEVIDAKGKVVCPGFVVVKARGLGAPRSGSDEPADSVNPFDPQIKMGLSAGITSFLSTFGSGSATPGGSTVITKLAWGDHKGMVVAKNTVLSMRVPLTPAQWRTLRERVEAANKYLAELAKFEKESGSTGSKGSRAKGSTGSKGSGGSKGSTGAKGSGAKSKKPKEPSGTKEILRVLRGEAKLWVTASGMFDQPLIRQAMQVAELMGKGVVLDNPVLAWTMPDEVAATGSSAILMPRARVRPDPKRPTETGSNLATAALLSKAGVGIAVVPGGNRFGGGGLGTGGILGHDLHTIHLEAAYCVRGGMDNRKALRTITLDAAKIIGADDRIGSIEVGKDADLLILDGDPLHYRTFVETAIVNGKVCYKKDEEPFYSHIKR